MSRRSRCLALHTLEDRFTPAGNLTARLLVGSLVVTGDAESNTLAVTQTAPGSFTITTEDGTTVNGNTDPVTVSGVTRDLVLRLGRGNDRVRFGAGFGGSGDVNETVAVSRDLVVDGGPGNNAIDNPVAALDVGRDLRLVNGDGGSRAEFRGRVTVGRDFAVHNGAGFNAVVLQPDRGGLGFAGQNSVRGDLTVRNGPGGADTGLSDLSVGGIVLVDNGLAGAAGFNVATGFGAGIGNPKAWVGGSVAFRSAGGFAVNALRDVDVRGGVLFQTGAGDSFNSVMSDGPEMYVGGTVTVRAGAGATRVDLGADATGAGALTVGGGLDVRTGAGADQLALARVRVNGDAALDTGADADQVLADDVVFGGALAMDAGAGNDSVVFESRVPDDFQPQAFIGATDVWGRATIALGAGDDTLRLGSFEDPSRAVRLFAPLRADGGAGTDLLDGANVTPAGRLRADRFEKTPPAPTFHRPARYAASDEYDYVTDVEAADLDGDGDLDLVTANAESESVVVFLNNGDGTFGFPIMFAAGKNPAGLAVGDFNGDQVPDLVVANTTQSPNGTVSILLGTGGGFFGEATPFLVGAESDTADVEVSDVNGDGKLDLVTANHFGNNQASASVLLGNGDGTFATATLYPLANDPLVLHSGWGQDVSVGDLNGDGKPDLVVSALRGLGVLLNNGDGTFAAPVVETRGLSTEVALADLDGDGKLDLVQATDGVVQFGNGDGTFGVAVSWAPDGVSNLAVGDFNRDGKLDVAGTTFDGLGVVAYGNGGRTFHEPQTFDVGPDPASLTAADLNGDGWLDLAVGNLNEASVRVLLNRKLGK
jgi:FG-GAP-like repeat